MDRAKPTVLSGKDGNSFYMDEESRTIGRSRLPEFRRVRRVEREEESAPPTSGDAHE